MSDSFDKTLRGKHFDEVFTEVTHTETLGLKNPEQLRLFHLNVNNNAFSSDKLEQFLRRNIGLYVFSRAQIEEYNIEGDAYSVGMDALDIMRRNGNPGQKGTGNDLGEILLYVFLEQVLGAPKIMSKVELQTGAKQYGSKCDGIHLLSLEQEFGMPYAITKFNLTDKRQMREIDVVSALRFADLLSKSTHAMNRDKHKMWAQEIIILLYSLYPDNPDVKFYAGSVFANTGNYQARRIIDSDFYGTTALERFFAEYQNDYLTIPAAPELRFFGAQKNAYDHLSDDHFSYSGPTSMGKSFLMRMYIKDQIQHGVKMNFALIVPTKALINEIYKQVIDEDLKNLLSEHNYKVVTAAGDIALEGKHNFILVLTPERLLYLLISKPDLQIDYLFIDEAHKLSGKNSRGPFYYKTVDMLLKRKKKPHFVF